MKIAVLLLPIVVGATVMLSRGFAGEPSEASLENMRTRVIALEEVRRPKGSGHFLLVDFEDLGKVRYSDEWSRYSAVKGLAIGELVDVWFQPNWVQFDPVLRIDSVARGAVVSFPEMKENIARDHFVDRLIGGGLLFFGLALGLQLVRDWRRHREQGNRLAPQNRPPLG